MIDGPFDEAIHKQMASRPVLDIEKMFTYQKPTEQAAKLHAAIEQGSKGMAELIINAVPECPEQTLAIRYLQMARMWANAGIALNHDKL